MLARAALALFRTRGYLATSDTIELLNTDGHGNGWRSGAKLGMVARLAGGP